MAHTSFPTDLPKPKDDGLYDHLTDLEIPANISLPIARQPNERITLVDLPGLTIVFVYPRTVKAFHGVRDDSGLANNHSAAPNETVPDSWNSIPGARGCTPQACSFRDNLPQLTTLGVSQIFGISTQSPSYQAEVHERLHLPYDLLSDEHLTFQEGLKLPTFEWEGTKVLRRSMIAIEKGRIVKWWYPVFPPDKGVDDVLEWLKSR